MNIFWINVGNDKTNRSIAESLNANGNYIVCDFALENAPLAKVSYFTFCFNTLKCLVANENQKDVIVININFNQLKNHEFELLYILSLVFPLDPIFIGNFPKFLSVDYGIEFSNCMEFDLNHNFVVDLERKMVEAKKTHISEISKLIEVFNGYGLFLSFGKNFDKPIHLKGTNGIAISYEEFIEILETEIQNDSQFLKNISKYAFLRDHTPIDLFVKKYLKK